MEFKINKGHKRIVIIGAIGIVAVSSILLVKTSLARYNATKNLNIASGTINYKVPDFKMIAMYKNDGSGDTPITTMPELGYEINTTKSYCTTDNINKVYDKMYTDENGQHVITGLSKDDKCYLYFDKICKGAECILHNVTVNESPTEFTGPATGNEGVFKTLDDDGETYYFRGAVTNNYVNFAGYYWRIIRINGDGTIRLIYQGPSATSTGTNAQIGKSAFNSLYYNNMYVGFKYTSNDVHGTGTESTILGALNTWYETNIENKGYSGKIDPNTGFCNDRDSYRNESGTTSGGGTGTTTTYYGTYIRLVNGSPRKPTFKCKNSSDLFTKSGATKKDGTANGNRALTYPIGLITADEVVYAGGYYGTNNTSFYLYTGQVYWTLSPCNYPNANMFYVSQSGTLSRLSVDDGYGVRPVINLKADTKFTYKSETTKGTASDPYVVS